MSRKQELRTFSDLRVYAQARAAISLNRNDPIAHAYWRETELWAVSQDGREPESPFTWVAWARSFAKEAAKHLDRPMEAALCYSRAKWVVILARNRGITMDPKVTGVNLTWLRKVSV